MRVVGCDHRGLRVGESHQNAVLSDHEVDLLRDLRAQGLSLTQLALRLEISKSGVKGILDGRRRSILPVRWKTVP